MKKLKSKLGWWLLGKIPRKLLYWCVIQAWSVVTTEKYRNKTPDEITCFDVMNYLERGNK